MYACTHVRTCVRVHTCVCTCAYAHTCVLRVCVGRCVGIRMCVYVCDLRVNLTLSVNVDKNSEMSIEGI